MLSLITVAGIGAAYVGERAYLLHFGAPDWTIHAPDAADVAEATVPLVALAALAGGLVVFLSATATRTVIGLLLIALGVTLAWGPGPDQKAGWWTVGVGISLSVGSLVLRWARRRWPERPHAGSTVTSSGVSSGERVLAGIVLFAFAPLGAASSWGALRAGQQSDFHVAGESGEWVVLRRAGDQLVAARRDTADTLHLRLTGEYALLKAVPDPEPVLVRRRYLVQDSATLPAPVRLRQTVAPRPERGRDGVADGSCSGPSREDSNAAVRPATRPLRSAESVIRLIGVERRRVSVWRLTYQVRRGALRGDSIRVAVRGVTNLRAAVCRGDSIITSAFTEVSRAHDR